MIYILYYLNIHKTSPNRSRTSSQKVLKSSSHRTEAQSKLVQMWPRMIEMGRRSDSESICVVVFKKSWDSSFSCIFVTSLFFTLLNGINIQRTISACINICIYKFQLSKVQFPSLPYTEYSIYSISCSWLCVWYASTSNIHLLFSRYYPTTLLHEYAW